jgi:thiazole/oxazole-forming peptide maturase SagC family component
MFKDMFDIVKSDEWSFQLHCAGKTYKIVFDNSLMLEMFEKLISSNDTYPRLVEKFSKKYNKDAILDFFKNLKENSLVFYEDDDALMKGKLYDPTIDIIAKWKEMNVGLIVATENSKAVDIAKKTDLVDCKFSIFKYNTSTEREKIEQFVVDKQFIIVDKTSYIPAFLSKFNKVAIEQNLPWLLISCIRANKAFVGPLFYGEQTGCYSCFEKRVKSAFPNYKELMIYENWLDEQNRPSHMGQIEQSHYKLAYQFAVLEVKKFLLNYGFPHTYKQMLEIDFNEYSTKWHHFYKVPFCSHCNHKHKDACAPWLDPISLEILK